MIETDRVRSIAEKLLEKTKAGLANWFPDPDDRYGRSCVLLLANSVVELTYRDDTAEAPLIRLDIRQNGTGKTLSPVPMATMSAYDNSLQLNEPITDPQDVADSALLNELYREATKFVYKWDVVLADIDQALAQPGKIGVVEAPKKPHVLVQALGQEPAHAPRR